MPSEDLERRRRFFYAEQDAGLYDASIAWVVPQYELLHETVAVAIDRAFRRPSARSEIFNVLDVGSGTGADTVEILRRYDKSHVVALDLCEPMLAHLRRQLEEGVAGASAADRCSTIHADILDFEITADHLLSALPPARRRNGFDVVVSSLTVHHFEHADKQAWFRRMFDVLAPGGFLIVADLFAHVDSAFTSRWLQYDMDWMRDHFTSADVDGSGSLSVHDRARLLEGWLKHYEVDNRLEPIESTRDAIGQAAMMETVGFRNVSTLYRYSLSGILVGQRPEQPMG